MRIRDNARRALAFALSVMMGFSNAAPVLADGVRPGTETVLMDGRTVNAAIKRLAGAPAAETGTDMRDTAVTKILRSSWAPDADDTVENLAEGTGIPVYAWFEAAAAMPVTGWQESGAEYAEPIEGDATADITEGGAPASGGTDTWGVLPDGTADGTGGISGHDAVHGTVFLYSEADTVYLPEDASYMFAGLTALRDISGLASLDFSGTKNADGLFLGDEALSDVSAVAGYDAGACTSAERAFEGTEVTDLPAWYTDMEEGGAAVPEGVPAESTPSGDADADVIREDGVVSGDHTGGTGIVSGDHTSGAADSEGIVSGDHTSGAADSEGIVSGDHTGTESTAPATGEDHGIVSGDHTGTESTAPATGEDHGVVSGDHTGRHGIVFGNYAAESRAETPEEGPAAEEAPESPAEAPEPLPENTDAGETETQEEPAAETPTAGVPAADSVDKPAADEPEAQGVQAESAAEAPEETDDATPAGADEAIPKEIRGYDFSSKRLLVVSGEPLDDEHVVSSCGSLYLLQYGTEEEAMRAYAVFEHTALAVEIDRPVFAASEGAGVVPYSPYEVTEDANPVSALADAPADAVPEGKKKTIALIDTGTSEREGVIARVSMTGDGLVGDDNGHGDAMADAILSVEPDAQILSIKALDKDARGNISAVYTAVRYAIDQGVDVISLSIYAWNTQENSALAAVIREAAAKGIKVVAAAGNDGRSAAMYTPGCVEEAVIVGACDENGNRKGFSNYGATVDYYVEAGSTSEAAAKMAGWLLCHDDADGFGAFKSEDESADYEIRTVLTFVDAKNPDPSVAANVTGQFVDVVPAKTEGGKILAQVNPFPDAYDYTKYNWTVFLNWMDIGLSEKHIENVCMLRRDGFIEIPDEYNRRDITVVFTVPDDEALCLDILGAEGFSGFEAAQLGHSVYEGMNYSTRDGIRKAVPQGSVNDKEAVGTYDILNVPVGTEFKIVDAVTEYCYDWDSAGAGAYKCSGCYDRSMGRYHGFLTTIKKVTTMSGAEVDTLSNVGKLFGVCIDPNNTRDSKPTFVSGRMKVVSVDKPNNRVVLWFGIEDSGTQNNGNYFMLTSKPVEFNIQKVSKSEKVTNGDDYYKYNARFEVFNESGKRVGVLTTDEKTGRSDYITGLSAGTYTVKETAAPKGFKKPSPDTFKVTIAPGGTQTIVIPDAPYKKGKVRVRKTEEVTGKKLSGAIFKVYAYSEAEGGYKSSAAATLDDGNSYTSGWLYASDDNPDGKFKIKETKTPVNHTGAFEKNVSIRLDEDGRPQTLEYEAVNRLVVRIPVIKLDKTDNKKFISGAGLELWQYSKADGAYKRLKAMTEGMHGGKPYYYAEDVAVTESNQGKFRIMETHAPEGYAIADPMDIQVTANTDPDPADPVAKAWKLLEKPLVRYGRIRLDKVDEEGRRITEGSGKFTVHPWSSSKNKYLATAVDTLVWSGTDRAYVSANDLTLSYSDSGYSDYNDGKFEIREAEPPQGYRVLGDEGRAEIRFMKSETSTDKATVKSVEMTNAENEFVIRKRTVNDETLEARFAIAAGDKDADVKVNGKETGIGANGTEVDTENGEIVLKRIPDGTYTYWETECLSGDGYLVDPNRYTFTVSKGNVSEGGQKTVVDTPAKKLCIIKKSTDGESHNHFPMNTEFRVYRYDKANEKYESAPMATLVWNASADNPATGEKGCFVTEPGGYVPTLQYTRASEGKYMVKETRATPGYILDDHPEYVEIPEKLEDGEEDYIAVTFENAPNVLRIHKVNKDGEPIEGAVFSLKQGTNARALTTDAEGYAEAHALEPGEWTLKETAVPAPYALDETEHTVTVNSTGYIRIDEGVFKNDPVLEYTVKNYEKVGVRIVKKDFETDLEREAGTGFPDGTVFAFYEYDKTLRDYKDKPYSYAVFSEDGSFTPYYPQTGGMADGGMQFPKTAGESKWANAVSADGSTMTLVVKAAGSSHPSTVWMSVEWNPIQNVDGLTDSMTYRYKCADPYKADQYTFDGQKYDYKFIVPIPASVRGKADGYFAAWVLTGNGTGSQAFTNGYVTGFPFYNITLKGNGGTPASQTVKSCMGASLTHNGASAPVRTGYTFDRWKRTSPDDGQYEGVMNTQRTSTYYMKAGVAESASMSAKYSGMRSQTWTAQWKANTYKIVYNGNGATSGTMSNTAATYDTSVTLRANAFSRTGYTFQGWAKTAGGAKAYDNKASVKNLTSTNNGTVTLYAVWKANTYKIAFNKNGGTGTMTAMDMTYGTAKNLTANAFTKPGYTFKGWAKSAGAATPAYTNKQSVKNLTSTNNATVTLYAVWGANSYTIKYNGNGSTSGSMADTSAVYDKNVTLRKNAFKKTGYAFAGWAASAAGAVKYDDEQTVKNLAQSGSVTLYAVWEAVGDHIKGYTHISRTAIRPKDASSVYVFIKMKDEYADDIASACRYAWIYPEWNGANFSGEDGTDKSLAKCADAAYQENRYTEDGRTYDFRFTLDIPAGARNDFGWFMGWVVAGPSNTQDPSQLGLVAGESFCQLGWLDGYPYYSITFDWADGKNTKETKSVHIGYRLGSDGVTTPTRAGYEFDHWERVEHPADDKYEGTMTSYVGVAQLRSTAVPGSGASTEDWRAAHADRSQTWRAVWNKAAGYTLEFDLDGGTPPEEGYPASYTEEDSVTVEPPEKEGFVFGGWEDLDNGLVYAALTIPEGSSGNRRFKARWMKAGSFVDQETGSVPFISETETNGGRFQIKEIRPTDGYILDDEEQDISLSDAMDDGAGGKVLEVEFKNVPNSIDIMKLEKMDGGESKPLAGITFLVWHADSVSDKKAYTTDGEGLAHLSRLKPGTWYYKEDAASADAKGYTADPNTYKIVVGEDGRIENAERPRPVVNAPKTLYMIHKVDAAGASIAGVNFDITDPDGSTVTMTTDKDGYIYIEDLKVGIYKFRESREQPNLVPGKYLLDNSQYFFIVEDGEVEGDNTIMVVNRGNEVTIKKNNERGEALAGAVFRVWNDNTDEESQVDAEKTTGSDGTAVMTNLPAGEYHYQEVKAPAGYALDDTVHDFTVSAEGLVNGAGEAVFTIVDEPLSVRILKVDEDGAPIDATFRVWNGNGYDETKTTSRGVAEFTKMATGTYRFEETSGTSGYVANLSGRFTLAPDGKLTVASGLTADSDLVFQIDSSSVEFEKPGFTGEVTGLTVEDNVLYANVSISGDEAFSVDEGDESTTEPKSFAAAIDANGGSGRIYTDEGPVKVDVRIIYTRDNVQVAELKLKNTPNRFMLKKIRPDGTPIENVRFRASYDGSEPGPVEDGAEYRTNAEGLLVIGGKTEIEKLPAGTYSFTETENPDGAYVVDTRPRTFTVDAKGIPSSEDPDVSCANGSAVMTVVNKEKPYYNVQIKKTDAATGKLLTGDGFEFVLQEWDGTKYADFQTSVFMEKTDTGEPLDRYVFEKDFYETDENQGRFRVVETKAGEGYAAEWSQEFTIEDINAQQDLAGPEAGGAIVMTLYAENRANEIRVRKVDADGNPVPGVKFELWREGDDPVEMDEAEGVSTAAALGDGLWHFREKEWPEYLVPDYDENGEMIVHDFTVENGKIAGETAGSFDAERTFTVTDYPYADADFIIEKTDENGDIIDEMAEDGSVASAVEFQVFEYSRENGDYSGDASAVLKFDPETRKYISGNRVRMTEDNIGKFLVREMRTGEGYAPDFEAYVQIDWTKRADYTAEAAIGEGRNPVNVAYSTGSDGTGVHTFLFTGDAKVVNEPNGILVQKTDENGQPLAGVTFRLSKAAGAEGLPDTEGPAIPVSETEAEEPFDVELTTGEDGTAEVRGLPDGAYVLEETSTLPGFALDASKHMIHVEDGFVWEAEETGKSRIFTVRVVNRKNGIRILKTDPDKNPLPGVSFKATRYGDDGNTAETLTGTTGTGGTLAFTDLKDGRWTLEETDVPNGVELCTQKRVFIVADGLIYRKAADMGSAGAVFEWTVWDDREDGPDGFDVQLTIEKRDADTRQKLSGAVFTVYADDPESVFAPGEDRKVCDLTDEDGDGVYTATLHAETGSQAVFYIEETKSPDGYYGRWSTRIDGYEKREWNFTLEDSAENFPKPKIEIRKVDGMERTRLLDGAEFEIWSDANPAKEKHTTGEGGDKGRITYEVPVNGTTYHIREVKAPDGYVLSGQVIDVAVDGNGFIEGNSVFEIEAVNMPRVRLHSGGEGRTMLYILGGCMTAALAGIVLFRRKKRKSAEARKERSKE